MASYGGTSARDPSAVRKSQTKQNVPVKTKKTASKGRAKAKKSG